MIQIILVIAIIYLLLGHGAYLQAEGTCKTDEDKNNLRAFRLKLYLNWSYYAVYIGKLREYVKQIKKEEVNKVEKTYSGDPDLITIELFSNGFNKDLMKGAAMYATYVVNVDNK